MHVHRCALDEDSSNSMMPDEFATFIKRGLKPKLAKAVSKKPSSFWTK